MKITKERLKEIIKEEMSTIVNEQYEGSPQQDLDRYLSGTFTGRREDLDSYLTEAGWTPPQPVPAE